MHEEQVFIFFYKILTNKSGITTCLRENFNQSTSILSLYQQAFFLLAQNLNEKKTLPVSSQNLFTAKWPSTASTVNVKKFPSKIRGKFWKIWTTSLLSNWSYIHVYLNRGRMDIAAAEHAVGHFVACDGGGCWTAGCSWHYFSGMNLMDRLKVLWRLMSWLPWHSVNPMIKHRCIFWAG